MEKKVAVNPEDSDHAQVHFALHASAGSVIFSRDRRTSLLQTSSSEQWTFCRMHEAGGEGLDEAIEFINWCGMRQIIAVRNSTVPIGRGFCIMGWINDPAIANEFRIRWC